MQSEADGWVKWNTSYDEDPYRDTSWLSGFRINAFKVLMVVSSPLLMFVVFRSWLEGDFPPVDFGNAVVFIILFFLVKWRPEWFRLIAWIGLIAFLINAFDGFRPYSQGVLVAPYILYPLLVLYGGLLGDVWIALVAFLFVMGMYGYSWINHSPLDQEEYMMLTNLCLSAVGIGIAALTVWFQHKKLLRIVNRQAQDLRSELDAKLRLDALIFHDINNPLFLMKGTLDLMSDNADEGKFSIKDIELLNDMTKRIAAIIESARGIGTGKDILMLDIPVELLFTEQQELFSSRLSKKNQTFVFEGEKGLTVYSNNDVLRNSVLSNFLSNAIKFSPRGTEIKMKASRENNKTRISIIDQGEGFPEDLLQKVAKGEKYGSKSGTEGELGTAYGLSIASICLRNLNGILEVRNQKDGGAEVSAILESTHVDLY